MAGGIGVTGVAFEGTITSSADAAAAEAGLLQAAAAPGADLSGIAGQLMEVSAQTARLSGLASQALEIQQAAVEVLGRITPVPQDPAFLELRAEALHTLALRFIEAGRSPEAVAPAGQAIHAYRDLAGTPGADRAAIAQSLLTLSTQVANGPQPSPAAALDAAQAAADVLGQVTPVPQDLTFRQLRADTLHTLALRFIEAGRSPEAVAPAGQAIHAYRDLAAVSDVHQVAAALQNLSAVLANAGLGAVALDAQQAAVDLLRPAGPPDDRPTMVAEALQALTARLVASQRLGEADTTARQAGDAYRESLFSLRSSLGAVAASLVPAMKDLFGRGLVAQAGEVYQLAAAALTDAAPPDPAGVPAETSAARQQILALQGQVGDARAGLRSLADLMRTAGLVAAQQAVEQVIPDIPVGLFCGVDEPVPAGPHPAGSHHPGDIRPLTFGPPTGRWTRGNLTVSIDPAGCNIPGGPGVAIPVIMSAFTAWQKVSDRVARGFFRFRFVAPGSGETVRVRFGGQELNTKFTGAGGVLGAGGGPPAGTLKFDSHETWTPAKLLSVAVHETGHVLGLSHSNTPGGTMNPVFSGRTTIDEESAQALGAIYGWSPQVNLPDRATADRAALAVTSETTLTAHSETAHMVWKGVGNGSLFQAQFDGRTWTPQQLVGRFGSSHTPALAQLPVRGGDHPVTGLLMAWKSATDQGIFWTRNLGAGWEPQRNIPGVGTSQAPALALAGGAVHMAWKGIKGDNTIFTSTFDGTGSWTPQRQLSDRGTSASPPGRVGRPAVHVLEGRRQRRHHLVLLAPGRRPGRGLAAAAAGHLPDLPGGRRDIVHDRDVRPADRDQAGRRHPPGLERRAGRLHHVHQPVQRRRIRRPDPAPRLRHRDRPRPGAAHQPLGRARRRPDRGIGHHGVARGRRRQDYLVRPPLSNERRVRPARCNSVIRQASRTKARRFTTPLTTCERLHYP
jgi:hypothetical protein